MDKFTSPAWAYWIGGVTIVSLIGLFVFLRATARQTVFRDHSGHVIATTGHVWDGDLQEFNNPLPRWWMGLFVLTLVFAVAYLVLYPGLAFFPGTLHFTSARMYRQESKAYEARIAPIYAKYNAMSVAALAKDPAAMATGQRLFLTYCAQCHGSDAGGSRGFPKLSSQNPKNWLYGDAGATLTQTITDGREGMMPPMVAAIGQANVSAVANYVRSLSGMSHDAALAAKGKPLFDTVCAACHGAGGDGNQMLGAPDLASSTRQWLFGSSLAAIESAIEHGHSGHMPAQRNHLEPEKIHVLAAYIYGLGHGDKAIVAQ